MKKTILLSVIFIATLFTESTKAQDDSNCGILNGDLLVDSITCWANKDLWVVFPVKSVWKDYDIITVTVEDPIKMSTIYERQWLIFKMGFSSSDFFDKFEHSNLGGLKIEETINNYSICRYELKLKNQASIHRSSQVIRIEGRKYNGTYTETIRNDGSVYKKQNYGNPIILWQSNPITVVTYGFKWKGDKGIYPDGHETYITGACSNNGKSITLKKEFPNYQTDYFIIKGSTNNSPIKIDNVKTETKTTGNVKIDSKTTNPKNENPGALTAASLKPLDKKKPGYFIEKDGAQIRREGYKKGNQLNGEVRDYTDGRIREVSFYTNNEKSGLSTYYFENGQIDMVGNMKNGEKEGEWKFYNDEGKLKETKKYSNGEVQD